MQPHLKVEGVSRLLAAVPIYQSYLTADELTARRHHLAARAAPDTELFSLGRSRGGEQIEVLRIGQGQHTALLVAPSSPDAPAGTLALDHLARELTKDPALRASLDYTWYLISCANPDDLRLNEGWFTEPLTVRRYARHCYGGSEPSTFPRLVRDFARRVKPDLICALGGAPLNQVRYCLPQDDVLLHDALRRLLEAQPVPLRWDLESDANAAPRSNLPSASRYFTCSVPLFQTQHRSPLSTEDNSVDFITTEYEAIKEQLTVDTPFRQSIERFTRQRQNQSPALLTPTDRQLHTLIKLGTFLRMLDAQIAVTQNPRQFRAMRNRAEGLFEDQAERFAQENGCRPLPIRTLVRLLLNSILLIAQQVTRQRHYAPSSYQHLPGGSLTLLAS